MRAAFPARASGPAERLAGFAAHLRLNGVAAGPAETEAAMTALAAVDAADPGQARLALKALFARGAEGWRRFDDLYDAYWSGRGRERPAQAATRLRPPARPALWSRHLGDSDEAGEGASGEGEGDGSADPAEGRRVAARGGAGKPPETLALAEAEAAATALARALRDRLSRRQARARRGALDLRRVARASLARGGEPIDLFRRRRRERPATIVALLDVSGSMETHARLFLAFLKGLARSQAATFVLHTRLARVCDALREPDALKAAQRLALMAEGFGGGTRLADCLGAFNAQHARGLVTRRTVALILSDGFDGCPPERLAAEMARLRRRAGRVFWLDPRAGAAPTAALAAALPHVDARLPAGDVAALGRLAERLAGL